MCSLTIIRRLTSDDNVRMYQKAMHTSLLTDASNRNFTRYVNNNFLAFKLDMN